jgi:hypothetical protein
MANMARQSSQTGKLKRPAKERMARIGNRDLTLAFLRYQRSITLGEVYLSRDGR